MSEKKEKQTGKVAGGEKQELNPDDAEVIIDRQISVLRRLNDELLRTTRTQAVIGAGLVTLISLIDARLFLPQTTNPLWAVGFIITFLSFIAWYNHIGAARLSYTDLQLGAQREVGENIPRRSPEPSSSFEQLKEFLSTAAIHLPAALSTFVGGSLTTSQFEKEIDPEKTRRLVAEDAAEAVRHNNWILRTRERYVNAVRGYLSWTFLVIVVGVLLMVVY